MYTIYGRAVGCPKCVEAKSEADKYNVPYTFIEMDEKNREQVIGKVTEATGLPPRTVPQIFLEDKYIGGCDEFKLYIKEDK